MANLSINDLLRGITTEFEERPWLDITTYLRNFMLNKILSFVLNEE